VEARRHFKIRENLLLDKLSDLIDAKKSSGIPLDREKRKIELAIRQGLRRGSFATGNGEKLLKRLVNFARLVGADLTDQVFYTLLHDWPSLRQTSLNWWQRSIGAEGKLHLIEKLLSDGGLVDDAAKVDVAVAIVAARLPKKPAVEAYINLILSKLGEDPTWGLYAKTWLLSRYGTTEELMSLVEKTYQGGWRMNNFHVWWRVSSRVSLVRPTLQNSMPFSDVSVMQDPLLS
jgi:hypothetical protein